MLSIQCIHWGKIRIGDLETYPPPEILRFVVFLRSGTIFIGTGFTGLVWKSGGQDFVMQDGDLWMEIPDPPEKLKKPTGLLRRSPMAKGTALR